ncbi:hypothetical protein DEO72_LG10g1156 [Vigna unguiculata]|uniref:Uncharacterized protein n=1 Tax=Vigna unguiculata TaxID=3917 RepID=A0A4D6N7V6_VIGUN|nr:hypothetical protein DEO72_LG10g1156 [Vigna unguiculata]
MTNEMVDKIKYLRALEGHKQVSQIQNLQHDFVFSVQESQLITITNEMVDKIKDLRALEGH